MRCRRLVGKPALSFSFKADSAGCKLLFIAAWIGTRSMRRHIEHLQVQAVPNSGLAALRQMVLLTDDEPAQSTLPTYAAFILKWSTGAYRSETERLAVAVSPKDVINLQFTSGKCSQEAERWVLIWSRDNWDAKGGHAHQSVRNILPTSVQYQSNISRNIVNNGRFVGDALRLTPNDVVCCPPPLFHCFGLVMGFLSCLTHGSSIVFPSDAFDPEAVMNSIIQQSATVIFGVPTMFVAELEVLRQTGLKPTSLRCGLSAGSAMPASLGERLGQEMGLDVVLIAYGMTETSPVSFITGMEDSEERRLKSIGRIIPHTMAKVIDQEGNILPRGQRGELCTGGFVLQKGYWENQARTDEVMKRDADGVLWMHTGDEVVIDGQGYGYITGRIKDIIIRGTFPSQQSTEHN